MKVWKSLSGWWNVEGLNEAHNGYIEVYLNLGWVGVVLISLILISGYKRAVSGLRVDPSFGGLMLAYLVAAAVYSLTEAGFRMMDPIWIFLLLAVVGASNIAAVGHIGLRPSKAPNAATPGGRLIPNKNPYGLGSRSSVFKSVRPYGSESQATDRLQYYRLVSKLHR